MATLSTFMPLSLFVKNEDTTPIFHLFNWDEHKALYDTNYLNGIIYSLLSFAIILNCDFLLFQKLNKAFNL